MNTETAILVAIVIAVIIMASVFGVVSGTIDEVGTSLFGAEDENGVFQPDEDGEYSFPEQGQQENTLTTGSGSYDSV